MNTVESPNHRIRAGDNPLQAEMRRIVEQCRRACEAERQAALTRYAYEYANEQLHDDVAALVVKVQTGRAA